MMKALPRRLSNRDLESIAKRINSINPVLHVQHVHVDRNKHGGRQGITDELLLRD